MKRRILLPILGLIIVAGLIIGAMLLQKPDQTIGESKATAAPTTETVTESTKAVPSNPCQVDYWMDGSLLEMQVVDYGESAYPEPVALVPEKVFLGWDVPLSSIEGNTTAKAQFYSTSGKTNCFALDSIYCPIDEEAVMYLTLRGNVDISSADFTIKYDASMLELVRIENVDPSIITNHDAERGTVFCSMLLEGEVAGEIDCLQLVFRAKESSSDTVVMIEVDDASTVKDDEIVDAEFETVNGNVFILDKHN